jgi:phosphoglycolate phosphatase-like HAD superfamily hydrolase
MVKAIIFDFDMTLVDSLHIGRKSREMLKNKKFSPDEEKRVQPKSPEDSPLLKEAPPDIFQEEMTSQFDDLEFVKT